MPTIGVIIPVHNEEQNLLDLYKRLKGVLSSIDDDHELIFVNDGSSDNSLELILGLSKQDESVYYINLSRNFGHQIAVSAGLNYSKADAVVIIDSDLQDPPELINKLFSEYKNGYDVVYAKRRKRDGEGALKKGTAKLFYRVLRKLVPFEIPIDTGDFRLISQKVVKSLNTMPEQNKFLRGQIAWLGFKQTYVFFDRDSRKKGETSYSYSKMFRLAFDGITGFSDKPLALVTKLGFIISFVAFMFIMFAIFSHFVLKETITGWTSIIVSASFLGGIQLFSIGIIGEYISRINRNVQNRPLYIIEATNLKNSEDKNS
ncbi:glycosyltransferase family 2 protein [Winogradskyella sp. A3E31]|uniref:glycosyltransferase family 2 protein n=1 Tax=Winogradskyella sp. A3E31 TaxID=3349637 RepID=UPI00398B0192